MASVYLRANFSEDRLLTLEEGVFTPAEILDYQGSEPRYRRILFIAPQPHNYDVPVAPSTTFGYLGEVLEQHGFAWRLVDLRYGGGADRVSEAIAEFQPDVIGFSFQFTIGARKCAEMLHEIAGRTDLPIIVGGPHLAIRGVGIMDDVPCTIAVRNEGEYPLLAIMKGVPLERIPNLWFRGEKDSIYQTKLLGFNKELDALPWPQYRGFDFKALPRQGTVDILTSRGCPYSCTFCSVNLTQGRMFRARSPENVVAEMQHWYDRGCRTFNFIDDILTVNQKRFLTILDLIIAKDWNDVILSCTQGMRADACTEEMLKKMWQAGFRFLGFGVESGSEEVLKTIKKGETALEIEEAIRIAVALNFEVGLFFIVGSPFETAADIEKSFALALKYPVMYAKFHVACPYPGTAMFKWADENKAWYINPEIYLDNYSYMDGQVIFDNHALDLKTHWKMVRKSKRIDVEVRRRYAQRGMLQKGYKPAVAWLMSHLFFNPVYFERVRRFQKTPIGFRITSYLARLFNLYSDAHTGNINQIAFTNGK